MPRVPGSYVMDRSNGARDGAKGEVHFKKRPVAMKLPPPVHIPKTAAQKAAK